MSEDVVVVSSQFKNLTAVSNNYEDHGKMKLLEIQLKSLNYIICRFKKRYCA